MFRYTIHLKGFLQRNKLKGMCCVICEYNICQTSRDLIEAY